MKKALVAAILGIALNVTTSHAQGFVIMENYKVVSGTPVFSGVTYAPGTAKAGQFVGAASGFKADLLFSLTGQPGSFALVAGSQTAFFGTSADGGTPTTDGAGSFLGPNVTIPGYTSGSVSFIVEAFNGSSYAQSLANNLFTGQSAVFSINGLQTNPLLPAGDLLNIVGQTPTGLQPFVVNVPEPSIFALAGLGAAGLMAFRRKK